MVKTENVDTYYYIQYYIVLLYKIFQCPMNNIISVIIILELNILDEH